MKNKCCVTVKVYFEILGDVCVSIQPYQPFPTTQLVGICNSYTMAVRDFADIYTQTPKAAGPNCKGVYISKITTKS